MAVDLRSHPAAHEDFAQKIRQPLTENGEDTIITSGKQMMKYVSSVTRQKQQKDVRQKSEASTE